MVPYNVVIPAPVFTRVNSGGYLLRIQLLEKNGFPINPERFRDGNDGVKKTYESVMAS